MHLVAFWKTKEVITLILLHLFNYATCVCSLGQIRLVFFWNGMTPASASTDAHNLYYLVQIHLRDTEFRQGFFFLLPRACNSFPSLIPSDVLSKLIVRLFSPGDRQIVPAIVGTTITSCSIDVTAVSRIDTWNNLCSYTN